MYRETFVPTEKNHSIRLPKRFFGKKIEVIINELNDDAEGSAMPKLPKGKKVSLNKLFETFGSNPDFPSVDEIRRKAWPEKW